MGYEAEVDQARAYEEPPEETSVAVRSGRPPIPVPRDLAEQLEFARVVLKSGLSLGHKSPESIVLALQLGSELGFTPMQALRCITVINGKPAPNADACVAAAMASDRCIYFREIETTEKSSTWETLRKGDPEPTRYTFTMQDAEHAGLTSRGSDTWKKYPKRMLAARAKKYLAQDKYPDILGGLLSAEELHDMGAQVVTEAPAMRRPRAIDALKEAKDDAARTDRDADHDARDLSARDHTVGGVERPPGAATSDEVSGGTRGLFDSDPAGEMRAREERREEKRRGEGKVVGPLPGCISQAKIAALMAQCHHAGVSEDQLRDYLGREYSITSRWNIRVEWYESVMNWCADQKPKSHAKIVSRPRPGGRR